jgi:hypothetical protein
LHYDVASTLKTFAVTKSFPSLHDQKPVPAHETDPAALLLYEKINRQQSLQVTVMEGSTATYRLIFYH